MNNPAYIRTTLNVRGDNHEKLLKIANRSSQSVQEIMLFYLEKMISILFESDEFNEHAMKYQAPADVWEKPHISFSKSAFDRFLDIKKVYRFSLSLVLAMALEYFGENAFFEESSDSYPRYSYSKTLHLKETERKYEFCWGFDTKTQEKPPD